MVWKVAVGSVNGLEGCSGFCEWFGRLQWVL